MSDNPLQRPIQAAKETTSKAVNTVKSRISILSDGEICDKCGGKMEATRTYDPRTAAFHSENQGKAPSYECGNCGHAIRREEDSVTFDGWG